MNLFIPTTLFASLLIVVTSASIGPIWMPKEKRIVKRINWYGDLEYQLVGRYLYDPEYPELLHLLPRESYMMYVDSRTIPQPFQISYEDESSISGTFCDAVAGRIHLVVKSKDFLIIRAYREENHHVDNEYY